MKQIAVFGGSFDPPQVCHMLVVTYALSRGGYDEIRLVPVFEHPFAKPLAPFKQRVEMLKRSLAHLGPKVVVDPIESTLPAPSYTIDTVKAMLAREDDIRITWLCGADVYEERHLWKRWDELETLVNFSVYGREGTDSSYSSPDLPELPNISSTDVRERIASGQPVSHLVPRDALNLIRSERLYEP